MINILANRYMIDAEWCFDEFQNYIQKDHKVVIIPFSFRDEQIYSNETWQEFYNGENGLYFNGVVDSFLKYGITTKNISWINYFTDSISEAKKKISNADILYFTGGLPDKMMERLKEFELTDIIRKHTGIILGFSAGAMIQMKKYYISPDQDYADFGYYEGMQMIDDFNIEVHFSFSDIQLDSINRVIKDTGNPVYAMEDEGAIIVDRGRIITVGKVHCFD